MKEFGSGYFGKWITDENGLPAYSYECNQLKDPAAISPTNELWRKNNDHSFQFGNDRIICLASNSGTVQVRQDEGSPKMLSDIDPDNHCYGGGIGWLIDGKTVLSTYYDGKADSFDRVYGAGYMRKTVVKGDLSAEQLIFTPYGDDPVLISRITIKNNSNTAKELKWYEYWGTKPYPLSLRTNLMSRVGKGARQDTYINNSAKKYRQDFAERYKHYYSYDGNTIHNKMKFKGFEFKDKMFWKLAVKKYRPLIEKVNNYSLYLGEIEDQEDINPPGTFLHAINTKVNTFLTDAKKFFGPGGPGNPDGLYRPVASKTRKSHTAMIAVSPVNLPANSEVTLTYLYGYVPKGFESSKLINKYSADFDNLFSDSCTKWKEKRISLKVPGKEWIDRELNWHNHSLRSALTYDTGFNEHILSQGHVYQYIIGFQGASRDPLQHVMPFIFTDAGLVREVLRYTFKSMLPDGTVPYGICGHGAIMITPFLSNDLELWLLWILAEYVLATKDINFLKEKVTAYPFKGEKQKEETILNLAKRTYAHFISIGVGVNDLPRILGGDWNDNVVVGNTDPAEQQRIYKEGESVLIGAFAAAVLAKYTEVLAMAGEGSTEVAAFAERQRKAVAKQWNGKWFRRAYLGSGIGWVDEDILYLEPQPWALLSGAADKEQAKILAGEIKKNNREPSPIGALLMHKCPDHGKMKAPKGMATNAGIWPSINGTLIMALNKIDPAEAYDEWRKNTLANHAEHYPEVWEGTWSGPDTFNSILSDSPGRTFIINDPESRSERLSWIDFPVYNLHPHAWTLYNAASLIADSFTKEGVVFNLGFPELVYKFESPLASLERTERGFTGSYCPIAEGKWKIELIFFDSSKTFKLNVNGVTSEFEKIENGISFYGAGGGEKPLKWEIVL
ncbi:MAG: hypothetical protein FWG77_11150 [Treponema sp.]|nr:hypothetical protein [Treponema sp.]